MIRARGRFALVAALAAGVGGCLSSPGGAGNAPIVGTWAYVATQDAPIAASLTGTLKIDNQSNGSFSGTLSVTETPSGGSPVQRGGPVSGQSLNSTAVQFEVLLDNGPDAVARTHLGQITGDSLVGNWAEETAGGASGSFRAHRVSIP